MQIQYLALHRIGLALTVPYKLAMGAVRQFDTILVSVETSDGAGLGEATILTGYTDETIDQSWRLAHALATRIAGASAEAAKREALAPFDTAPFTVSAFVSAIEMAEGHPTLAVDAPVDVPILAVINATDPDGIAAEIERFVGEGYGTLKVKVGFDANADAERVRLIQALNAGRARLRLDANQGYAREEACRFASGLNPDAIELFEQPCAAGDWDSAVAVARVATVPMMLDESIYGMADIERAASLEAASFVKLKLMKMGGIERLEAGLARIRALGMEPVLGNGVATELGCWMEACVARRHIRNAGEMNGFLKPAARLLRTPLVARSGAIALTPGVPALDDDAVRRVTIDSVAVRGASRARAAAR